ncbi:MAG: S8 family serine peptidase [Actinomycetota bacterium]
MNTGAHRAKRTLAVLLLAGALVPSLGSDTWARAAKKDRFVTETLLGPGVIAHIDAGINPYSIAFRDRSPLARKHPSTYIEGYPKNAPALHLSLDLPYEDALKRDEATWARVQADTLYWIPGTRIVGAISFGSGGTCPREAPPPANGGGGCMEHRILDDHGHGTMTASRMAGDKLASLAPTARIVSVEGLGGGSVTWAAEQGWIDVQTNSWLSLLPPPLSGRVADETSTAFRDAAEQMFTIAASGNGTAYVLGAAPTPTYLLSTAAPGVVLVGGHDNGKLTLWAGSPPHVVADAYGGVTALRDSSTKIEADPIACCTSAAAPYAAGGAMAIVQRARAILGSNQSGIDEGIIAKGAANKVKEGPLADGDFTLEELRQVFFHTAEALPGEGSGDGLIHWAGEPRAPDHTAYGPGGNPFCLLCTTTPVSWSDLPDGFDAYPFVGYGAINERSLELAFEVLAGTSPLPERPAEDAQYAADQALRGVIFP